MIMMMNGLFCLLLFIDVIHGLQFYATTVRGMEGVLAREVAGLTDVSTVVQQKGGVKFTGSSVTAMER